jgi:hypothetical protein
MDSKTLSVLEYPRILDRLAANCSFSASVELARALQPSTHFEEILRLQAETSEARRLLATSEASIGGAHDVRPAVELARRGGVIDPQEMLDIKSTLISARNHGEMWLPNIHIRLQGPTASYLAPGARLSSYGMGWFLQDFDGRLAVHHGGNIDGMSAMVAMLPDENLGVVVLTNMNGSPAPLSIFPRVFDLFTRDTPRDWNAEYLKIVQPMREAARAAEEAQRKARVPGTRPSLELAKYAGTYTDSLYGDIVITEKDGALSFQFGRVGGAMEHWHYDTFRASMAAPVPTKATVSFILDAKGAPAELKLDIAPESRFRAANPGPRR